jgi:hypothetical protein
MPQISHAIEMIQAKVEEWKRNYQQAGGQLPMESAAPKSYWDEPAKPQMAPQQQYGAPPQGNYGMPQQQQQQQQYPQQGMGQQQMGQQGIYMLCRYIYICMYICCFICMYKYTPNRAWDNSKWDNKVCLPLV